MKKRTEKLKLLKVKEDIELAKELTADQSDDDVKNAIQTAYMQASTKTDLEQ